MAGGKHFKKGLDDRQRDKSGAIRKKRGDTTVATLRREYGEHFAAGYRSDMHLATLLKREGADSLHQLLKKR